MQEMTRDDAKRVLSQLHLDPIMHGVDGMLDGGSLEWKGIFFILFYSKLRCTKLWIRSWL
jgi:hypothetical protein